MDLLELTDQTRVLLALMEKLFENTEFADNTEDQKVAAALEFHCAALAAKRLMSDISRIAEDILVAAMKGERRATIDGTTIEIRRAYRRTDWEHAKLATHVALSVTGGELVEGMAEVIDAFVKACRPEWRVSYLKELGLDDQDYCSRDLGRATVTVL